MMAAAQPFLSGAISKTVNLPSDATVEDIELVHMEAWKLGVKCVALYRDGSKSTQPLSTGGAKRGTASKAAEMQTVLDRTEPSRVPALLASAAETLHAVNRAAREALGQPPRDRSEYDVVVAAVAARAAPTLGIRRRLPKKRRGFTQEARIGGHKVFLRTGEYDDGSLGEIFIDVSKAGGAMRSMANAFAIAVSLGLQHGVPLGEFVDAFQFMRFEPAGVVQGDENGIRFATSIVDYTARVVGVHYLARHELAHVPVANGMSAGESAASLLVDAMDIHHTEASAVAQEIDATPAAIAEADHCQCGGIKIRTGKCMTCQACGTPDGGCS